MAIVSTEGELRTAAHDVGLPAFRSVDAAQQKRLWRKHVDEEDELAPWTPSRRKRHEAERAAVDVRDVPVERPWRMTSPMRGSGIWLMIWTWPMLPSRRTANLTMMEPETMPARPGGSFSSAIPMSGNRRCLVFSLGGMSRFQTTPVPLSISPGGGYRPKAKGGRSTIRLALTHYRLSPRTKLSPAICFLTTPIRPSYVSSMPKTFSAA